MHELAITESILEIAIRHAQAKKASRITDLYLVLGQWSSVVDDSVQFYWDIISDGTIAKGATLHFRRVPVVLTCQDCGKEYRPANEEFACSHCGGTHVKVKTGEEFHLEAIDVDE
jgi:hydrogenase nickel incorporation protein HypA/HybF